MTPITSFELVPLDGLQLLDMHQQPAIAFHQEHLSLGSRRGNSERKGEAIADSAELPEREVVLRRASAHQSGEIGGMPASLITSQSFGITRSSSTMTSRGSKVPGSIGYSLGSGFLGCDAARKRRRVQSLLKSLRRRAIVAQLVENGLHARPGITLQEQISRPTALSRARVEIDLHDGCLGIELAAMGGVIAQTRSDRNDEVAVGKKLIGKLGRKPSCNADGEFVAVEVTLCRQRGRQQGAALRGPGPRSGLWHRTAPRLSRPTMIGRRDDRMRWTASSTRRALGRRPSEEASMEAEGR